MNSSSDEPYRHINLGERFDRALLLASELHRQQRRKGGAIPYVSHLLAVCALVLEHGGDEDQAIAALLHDAVEDQGGEATLQQIRQDFGDRVADWVLALSDTTHTPKPPWKQRKQAYIDALPSHSLPVLQISACDKLHNARSMRDDFARVGPELWTRFHAGPEQIFWYYRSLADVYRAAGLTSLGEAIAGIMDQLQSLNQKHQI